MSKKELYKQCCCMGNLLGKTLYRLLERGGLNTTELECFQRRVRVSAFAGGPKKFGNLVNKKSLLTDVKRSTSTSLLEWNAELNSVTDKFLKWVRDGNEKKLVKWLGPNFRSSELTQDEFIFIFCEAMGITHYIYNARLTSMRERCKHRCGQGRLVLRNDSNGNDTDDDKSSDDDG